MKLIILRHGESLDDIENRYGGYANYDLTEKGFSQAKEVVEKLRKYQPQAIITSPYQRAFQTASIVSEGLSIPLNIDTRIRERNTFGFLSGMNIDKAKQQFPVEYELAQSQETSDKIDGAELMKDAEKRLTSFFTELKTKAYDTVIIVMHGKVIEILQKYVLKNDLVFKCLDCGFGVIDLSTNPPHVIETVNCK